MRFLRHFSTRIAKRQLGFLCAIGLIASPAAASDGRTIEFDATSGAPITQVVIGETTYRFALDPLLGPFLTVNPKAREGLEVSSLKEGGISASIDGARIKGSLAKVRLKVGRRSHSVEAALINRDHLPEGASAPYDVAGGFEALPAQTIIVHLNKELTGPMREIAFSRRKTDMRAGFPIGVAGVPMRLNAHFANSMTWLDRRAAEALINLNLIEPTGEVEAIPVWYGLRMPVQSVKPMKRITLKGIPLGKLQARTDAPLILPEPDKNVILVQRTGKRGPAPSILLGIDTLRQCAKMVFDRRKRRLTFTCPA